MAIRRQFALASLFLCLSVMGCGGHQSTLGAVSAEDAIVLIKTSVLDAEVWVDGRYIATVGALRSGFAIEEGAHRIEVRHKDHHTVYMELHLGRREKRQITLDLPEVLL